MQIANILVLFAVVLARTTAYNSGNTKLPRAPPPKTTTISASGFGYSIIIASSPQSRTIIRILLPGLFLLLHFVIHLFWYFYPHLCNVYTFWYRPPLLWFFLFRRSCSLFALFLHRTVLLLPTSIKTAVLTMYTHTHTHSHPVNT